MQIQEPEYHSSVTLLVLGEELKADTVSDLLKLEPDKSWQQDDKHEWGGWKKMASETEGLELPQQLEHWLSLLHSRCDALGALASLGLYIALDCFITPKEEGGGTASIQLPPELIEAIGSLGVELRLSFLS